MRAAVLEARGRPLRILDLELDPPRAGEVSVRMLASGVCHSDVHRADGDWGGVDQPVVLGHEGAGIVEELGEGVEHPRPGQLVVLNWNYPCRACDACRTEREWMCAGTRAGENLQQDGTTRLHAPGGRGVNAYLAIGTFAEREVTPAQAAVPIASDVPPEVAALIGCCIATGVGAVVNTARVQPGASVAVIGLGGVGLSAIMGSALAGAGTIVAVDRAPDKLDLARSVGADGVVQAGDDPAETIRQVRALTGGGPDFAFETAGRAATAQLAVDVLPSGGTAVLVGLPPRSERASFEVFGVVDRSQSIVGSLYGWSVPSRDFPALAEHYRAGRLPIDRLIEETIDLSDVNRALDALRAGRGARRVIRFG